MSHVTSQEKRPNVLNADTRGYTAAGGKNRLSMNENHALTRGRRQSARDGIDGGRKAVCGRSFVEAAKKEGRDVSLCPHPYANTRSESEAYSKLCLTRKPGSADKPVEPQEIRDHAPITSGVGEIGAVGDIEHFSKHVERPTASQPRAIAQPEVELHERRSASAVAAPLRFHIAHNVVARLCERIVGVRGQR